MQNFPRDSEQMAHLRDVWIGMYTGRGRKWKNIGHMAVAAGLGPNTLYDWIPGVKQAQASTILKLSRLTGTNFLVLMWLSGYLPVEEVWELLPPELKAPMERQDLIEKT